MAIRLKGSTSGSVELDVPAAVSGGDVALTLPNGIGSAEQFLKNSGTAGELEFSSMVETSTGVGIGTASPGSKLHLKVDGTGTLIQTWQSDLGTNDRNINLKAPSSDSAAEPFTFQTGNSVAFQIDAAEAMRIDSSGRLLVGTPTSLDTSSIAPKVQSADAGNQAGFGAFRYSANSPGPILHFFKSRGTSVGTNTIVVGGDKLGEIRFTGADGTNEIVGASIDALVDGTPGTNDMPGRLVFSTTADGASSPTERMRIGSSGQVGIGTSSPSTLLHVAGTTRIGANSTGDAELQIGAGASGNRNAYIDLVGDTTYTDYGFRVLRENGGANTTSRLLHRGTGDFRVIAQEAAPIQFWTSNTERMRIDSDGRLLSGATTAPNLNNAGGANARYPANLFYNTTTDVNRRYTAAFIGGSNNTSGALVRLGKTRGTSPTTATIVQNNDNIGQIDFVGTDGTQYVEAAKITCEVDGTPGVNDMPGRLVFSTSADGASSATARLTVNRNGEVRMAYTGSDPVSTDPVNSIGNAALFNVTSNVARLVMQERSGLWISFKDGAGTHYGTITRNSPGVTYGSNSDYRLKENVQNFTGGINLVKQLRPITFNWNELSGFPDTTSVQRGFLAHEVQEVEPGAVAGNKDEMDRYGDCYDAEGTKTQTNVFEHQTKEGETWTFQSEHIHDQQLDPAKLVPLLTAALQEAIAKIETLEQRLSDAGIA